MRLDTMSSIIFCLDNEIPIEYRIKANGPYKWAYFDYDKRLVLDLDEYDYYVDRPISLWYNKCLERYKKLQGLGDLDFERMITLDDPESDLLFDEASYVGFLHVNERINEGEHKIYQVRMDYGSKWIGVWHLEGMVNEKD